MRKFLLTLLTASMFTPLLFSQTTAVVAKWTPAHQMTFDVLPAHDQNITLSIPEELNKKYQDVSSRCEKMSNELSTWRVSDDGKNFIIAIHPGKNPNWKATEWQMYLNRLLGANFPS